MRKENQPEKNSEKIEGLSQAEKLEALARFSAKVAREFNDILVQVSANSEFLMSELDEKDPNCSKVNEIQEAVLKGCQLTEHLLMFASEDLSRPVPMDLNKALSKVLETFGPLLAKKVEVRLKKDPDLHSVEADPVHIEQVLVHLLSNAQESMPQGGRIKIETRNITLETDLTEGSTKVPAGDYVILSITDTGKGMDAEDQDKIFEPYFSGRGMSLAAVYGVMKKSRGHIVVSSEKGHGTSMTFFFPAVTQKIETSMESLYSDWIKQSELPMGPGLVKTMPDLVDVSQLKELCANGPLFFKAVDTTRHHFN